MIGDPHLLWIERGDGAAIARRAVQAGQPCLAVVDGRRQRAVPIRLANGYGDLNRLVPVAHLAPAAPLTDAEEAEYARLDAQLAGTPGEARTLRRFNGLRLRSLMFGGAA